MFGFARNRWLNTLYRIVWETKCGRFTMLNIPKCEHFTILLFPLQFLAISAMRRLGNVQSFKTYMFRFFTDMCSLCWQKCGPGPNCSLDLIYFQRSGVFTHWFSHMCFTLLLAYMRNRRILIGKSEALLSWLAICLLFWWFYLSSVWWLRKYLYVKIRLYEGLKFYEERLWLLC